MSKNRLLKSHFSSRSSSLATSKEMSWKGFQKAIARLPQIVKQKTGLAEGTVDEEFKELNLTYVRIKQDTTKFLNECISYKAAMLNLLNFQVSLMEEHQWNLTEFSDQSDPNGQLQKLQNLRNELSSQLEESVDRLLIKPLTEYQLLLIKVDSIIKKRNNKLLDYDRNRVTYEKMMNNPARRNEMSEEKKILKQEQALNQATMEYDRYNNLLKIELPRLLDLRSQLLKPGIQTLLAFQKVFYSRNSEIFSSSTIAKGFDSVLKNPEQKFEKEIDPIMKEIRSMGMFHGSGLLYTTESPNIKKSEPTEDLTLSPPPQYSKTTETTTSYTEKDSGNTATAHITRNTSKPAAPIPPKSSKRYVKAVYDFKSEDSEDLSFKMGDLIEVLDSSDKYGWWVGKDSKGKKGNFPSNYVMEK